MNINKQTVEKIIFSLGLLLIMVGTSATSIYFCEHPLSSILPKTSDTTSGKSLNNKIQLTSATKPDLSSLSFANVEKHEVPGATKTVIYIPQLHREPTSTADESVNDQALEVQKEIATIIGKLDKENNVKYVMDETDLYGSMPEDKVEKIKTALKSIEEFKADLNKIIAQYIKDGGNETMAASIKQQTLNQVAKVERRIYLTGGAAVMAAKDSSLHVYGSQNSETIKVAQAKLQQLVYIEKRIAQLEGSGTQTASTSTSSSSIVSLLGRGNSSSSGLTTIASFAQSKNDSDLLEDVQKASSVLRSLTSQTSFESSSAAATTNATNSYANRTDLAALKAEYQTAQSDFMKIAKDQRSQEVCDNMVKMMDDNRQSAAVLVFGEGHKEQLIDMFNKKGVSVIVVTPESE